MRIVAGLLAGILLFGAPAQARDAREVGDWLCQHVFEGEKIALAFTCDGFFGMSLADEGRPGQDITGLWSLDEDGISLHLFNRQDAAIHMTVGQSGLHASIGDKIHRTLVPAPAKKMTFKATGMITRDSGAELFTDAASGKQFPIKAPDAAANKFATVELEFASGEARARKALTHSRTVPRFFRLPPESSGPDTFAKSVAGRYWILPSLPGVPKAVLRLAAPDAQDNGAGYFEITGPGVRLEGKYALDKNKLTLKASRDSVRNTLIMGAGALVEALKGPLSWRLGSRGLELTGTRKLLLLPSGG